MAGYLTHAEEANRLLLCADDMDGVVGSDTSNYRAHVVAMAQVEATLAVAAATNDLARAYAKANR